MTTPCPSTLSEPHRLLVGPEKLSAVGAHRRCYGGGVSGPEDDDLLPSRGDRSKQRKTEEKRLADAKRRVEACR
jgi:hypothetical protein